MTDNSKQMLRRKFLKTSCFGGVLVASPFIMDVIGSSPSGAQVKPEKPTAVKERQKLEEIVRKYGSEFGDVKVNV